MVIITKGVTGGPVGTRQEIRTFTQDADLTNLYLLALARFQAVDQKDPESYFQISGIHGRPYRAFDGVGPEGNFGGYCTHSSVIFPTWHRPYVALYEQTLHKHVTAIANEYTDPGLKQRFQTAAARFRVPYWDWALDATLPDIVARQAKVTVLTPQGQSTEIPNPLYSYKFHPMPEDFADGLPSERTWEAWSTTLRNPTTTNPQTASTAQTQPERLESLLDSNKLTLRDRTFNLLTQATTWAAFSNDGFQGTRMNPIAYDSLESIHGQIHGLTGQGGHMSAIDFAAFDPVFWLHHTNVDRVLTIWQAINPTAWIQPRPNNAGTFTTRPGTVEDENSPLTPFRRTESQIWTSKDSRDTRTFGYTYPELAKWEKLSVEEKRARLRTEVNALYGKTSPAASLRTSGTGTANKPWVGVLPAEPPKPSGVSPAAPKTTQQGTKPVPSPPVKSAAPVPQKFTPPPGAPPPGPPPQQQSGQVPVSAPAPASPAPAPAPAPAPSQPPTSAASKPAGVAITQQQYNEQLTKHRDAHVAYWHAKNVNNLEVYRYEAGFQQGWEDTSHSASKLDERKAAHIAQRGTSDLVWEYEHGYNEATKAYKEAKPAGGPSVPANVQQQYNEQFARYRDAHITYWHARNVQNLEVYRFEAGFQQGWEDCTHGTSKLEERKITHVSQHGSGNYLWEFDHGYNEAFQAYKRITAPKPTEQHYDQQVETYSNGHATYWKGRGRATDIDYYKEGFRYGWEDVAIGASKGDQRKREYIRHKGQSQYTWEFDQGYRESFAAYKEVVKKLPAPPSAPPQRPTLPTYDSGHAGPSYVPPAAAPPAAAYPPAAAPPAAAYPPATAPPAAAPPAAAYPPAAPAKVSTADKAREQAYHALHKGQSTLGSLFHQAAGSVQSHTQGTRVGQIGGQTAQVLDKLAHTIGGPAGHSQQVQALVAGGGQLLQNVLAQLPAVVPDRKINGHSVRQYHEWIANIRVEKYAAESTFFVHVFLGDFDSDPDNWATDKNLVGSHVVFTSNPGTSCEKCISDRERGTIVTGTIPLTGALGDKFGNVYDLNPEHTSSYLKNNLHWRVIKSDGTPIDREQIPSLSLSVGYTKVDVPDAEDEFPVWGNVHLDLGITNGRIGGAHSEDDA